MLLVAQVAVCSQINTKHINTAVREANSKILRFPNARARSRVCVCVCCCFISKSRYMICTIWPLKTDIFLNYI